MVERRANGPKEVCDAIDLDALTGEDELDRRVVDPLESLV